MGGMARIRGVEPSRLGGRRAPAMARNTLSSRFRRVDIDEFDKNKFVDEQEEAAAAGEPGPDPGEVDGLLRQGDMLRAFHAALRNSPINTKNQAVKDRAQGVVLKVLTNFKSSEIEQAVQSLDRNGIDLLMKYIYKGFEKPTENSSAVLLQWHEKALAVSFERPVYYYKGHHKQTSEFSGMAISRPKITDSSPLSAQGELEESTVQMKSRRKENVSKEGKTRGNLHPTMDGDTDRDPHWSTGLSPPKVQMRSRRRKNMKKEIRTARADAKVIADTRLPGVLCCQKLMFHFGVIFDVRSIFSQMEMCCERHWVAFFSKKTVVRSRKVNIQTGQDPKKPVHADETRPSAIVNGFSVFIWTLGAQSAPMFNADQIYIYTFRASSTVSPSCGVQEGEYPNRLDPKNPVYAEETSPSVIVNGFSERLRASHIQRIRPNSDNLEMRDCGFILGYETSPGSGRLPEKSLIRMCRSWLCQFFKDQLILECNTQFCVTLSVRFAHHGTVSEPEKSRSLRDNSQTPKTRYNKIRTIDLSLTNKGQFILARNTAALIHAPGDKDQHSRLEKQLKILKGNYEQHEKQGDPDMEYKLPKELADTCTLPIPRNTFYLGSQVVQTQVQEGEHPNRLDPKNPVYAEETSPSVIVNGFSERLRASHIQRIRPHSENLVQEGEYPNRLDPQNPVYAEETSPSVIVNGFSERLRASHIQRIWPNSENLIVEGILALAPAHLFLQMLSNGSSLRWVFFYWISAPCYPGITLPAALACCRQAIRTKGLPSHCTHRLSRPAVPTPAEMEEFKPRKRERRRKREDLQESTAKENKTRYRNKAKTLLWSLDKVEGEMLPWWSRQNDVTFTSPNEKQKEREREQRRQDQREPSSDDGWRYRRRPTLQHRTEPPKAQMRSRRRKNMKKEIRTARGPITH
ncbi:hypothetical protein U0070_017862 [Myodes glareolus]|uniref:Actin-related protein 2/3 complex subunit 5 n=1 Tax=Myodes glareolus TaxID=447135 RepID=A0AAW0KBR6_MYOGA